MKKAHVVCIAIMVTTLTLTGCSDPKKEATERVSAEVVDKARGLQDFLDGGLQGKYKGKPMELADYYRPKNDIDNSTAPRRNGDTVVFDIVFTASTNWSTGLSQGGQSAKACVQYTLQNAAPYASVRDIDCNSLSEKLAQSQIDLVAKVNSAQD